MEHDLPFVLQHLLSYAAELDRLSDVMLDASEQRGYADRAETLRNLALERRARARECREAVRRLERG